MLIPAALRSERLCMIRDIENARQIDSRWVVVGGDATEDRLGFFLRSRELHSNLLWQWLLREIGGGGDFDGVFRACVSFGWDVPMHHE